MYKNILVIIAVVAVSGFAGYYLSGLGAPPGRQLTQDTKADAAVPCIPTFRDGGGPYYQPNSPFREKLVAEPNNGERLIVKGRIMKSDCITGVPGAVLDIWQANESGRYEDTWYRGQVRASSRGEYSFETVVPKGYGEGTGYRPPHIHFKVFVDGTEAVTSQIFFPEVKGTPGFEDAYIMKVESTEEQGKPLHRGTHDIILP